MALQTAALDCVRDAAALAWRAQPPVCSPARSNAPLARAAQERMGFFGKSKAEKQAEFEKKYLRFISAEEAARRHELKQQLFVAAKNGDVASANAVLLVSDSYDATNTLDTVRLHLPSGTQQGSCARLARGSARRSAGRGLCKRAPRPAVVGSRSP